MRPTTLHSRLRHVTLMVMVIVMVADVCEASVGYPLASAMQFNNPYDLSYATYNSNSNNNNVVNANPGLEKRLAELDLIQSLNVLTANTTTEQRQNNRQQFQIRINALVSASLISAECGAAIQFYDTINSLPYTIESRLYNGHWINDLGDFYDCQDVSYAHYCSTSFVLNISGLVLRSFTGFCVPKVCNSSEVAQSTSVWLGIPLGFVVAPNTTMASCVDEQGTWSDVSAAVVMVVVSLVFLGLTLLASLAHMIRQWMVTKDKVGADDDEENNDEEANKGARRDLKEKLIPVTQKSRGSVGGNTETASSAASSSPGSLTPKSASRAVNSEEGREREGEKFEIYQPAPEESPSTISVFWNGFIDVFNIQRNLASLVKDAPSSGTDLSSLNGLRVFSMAWVIMGHSALFSQNQFQNLRHLYSNVVPRFTFQAIINAYPAVDSFFFMSGLLGAYLLLVQLKKKGDLPWALYYIHRYLRLTPIYAFWLLMYWLLSQPIVFGAGPWSASVFFGGSPNTDKQCNQYWWTNLLYINNFYPTGFNDQCMGWGWYLANDMQFSIVLPFIVFLYYRQAIVGIITSLVLLTATLLTNLIIVNKYSLNPSLSDSGGSESYDIIYSKPYTRAAPYIIGILTAFYLHGTSPRQRLSSFSLLSGICVSITFMVTTVYGVWKINGAADPRHYWTMTENMMYITFSRCAWALALAFLTVACTKRQAWIVGSILEWKIFTPLAKLTYGAYLAHEIWLGVFSNTSGGWLVYNDLWFTCQLIANVSIGYALSFASYLCVEKPFMNLEEKLFARNKSK